MSRLMRLIAQQYAEHPTCVKLFCECNQDPGITAGVLPLRLGAALHALVLEKINHSLVEVYPPHPASDEALSNAVFSAIKSHEQFIREWLKSPPQTNEVRRAAPIIAGLNSCLARYPLPVMISELGASAGFNLLLDRYSLDMGRNLQHASNPILTLSPEWMGLIPAQQPMHITDRAGVDINPLDPMDRSDYLRLLSYTWADQCDRLDRIKLIAPHQITPVDKGDASQWLPNRLMAQPDQTLHFVFHTIALQYFPQESKEKIIKTLNDAGKTATSTRPLAYMSMEADDTLEGAKLTLQIWPKGTVYNVGRADFHGRWVSWGHPNFG